MILNIIVRTFLSPENGMDLNRKHTAYGKVYFQLLQPL